MREAARAQRGIVLIAVLFFIALLVSGVATFLRRATLDGMIARNRDLTARSEALARGGVQLATALLLQDRLDEVEYRRNALRDLVRKHGIELDQFEAHRATLSKKIDELSRFQDEIMRKPFWRDAHHEDGGIV